jgi:hypothetical protein
VHELAFGNRSVNCSENRLFVPDRGGEAGSGDRPGAVVEPLGTPGQDLPASGYLNQLTSLRDALKSAHGVEATPDHNAARRTVTGEEPVTRRIRKQRDDLVVEPENPVVGRVSLEETKTVEAVRPLPQVAEPERKLQDEGRFMMEPAEPVLEFRRAVADSRTWSENGGNAVRR